MKTLLFILLIPLSLRAQIITTVAGSVAGYSGDGGAATLALLNTPGGVVFDNLGNMYIGDAVNNRIRKVDASGIITTIAGNGTLGFGGDGGFATSAMLNDPGGLVFDNLGNLYIADGFNYRIRTISRSGIISTYAGNGTLGYSGYGGLATNAEIGNQTSVAMDVIGNLYFSDTHSIAKVSPAGIINIIAGTGSAGYSGDGGPATAAQLNGNEGVALDKLGNIYIADYYNNRIRKIDSATQIITTIAGGIYGYSGDGGPATNAQLKSPFGIVVDASGNVFFSEYNNNIVRKISTSGIISTVAGTGTSGFSGDGGPATAAEFYGLYGIALDACGNLYVCDGHNARIRKISFNPVCNDSVQYALNAATIKSNTAISLYPNPATTTLTVTAPTQISKITINNLTGQTIYEQTYQAEKAGINVAALPPGMYIVAITDVEGNKVVRKFIKE